MLHRVATLALIFSAATNTTCLPTTAATAVVGAAAELAKDFLMQASPDYETNTNRLGELLVNGDFWTLTNNIKTVIQGKPSNQRMDFLAWLYTNRHVSPLGYLYFRTRAANPGTISRPIALDDLHTIHLFCLNFYVHSFLWIRTQKKASILTMGGLIAEKDRIRGTFGEIKTRIQHWFEEYKKAGLIAYHEVYGHTKENIPAGATNPLWTLGVTRDDGTLHAVGNSLKSIPFVGRLLGDQTGGLLFTTPEPRAKTILRTISDRRLNRWYAKAMQSLLQKLETVGTWEEFFDVAALDEWLEDVTDERKQFMRRARPARSASGAGAGCALDGRRSSHTAEDGSIAGDETYIDGCCPTCRRAADQQDSDEYPTEEEVDEEDSDEGASDGEGGSVASASKGLESLSLRTPGTSGGASAVATPGGAGRKQKRAHGRK